MSTINMKSEEVDENPREIEARRYLEAHRIPELIDNMTAMLIYMKPGKVLKN